MRDDTTQEYDPDTGAPIGYLPRWSYRPGDLLNVHTWCTLPWRADIVRLHYGDPRPDGPGLQETPITEPGDVYEPVTRPTFPGSMAWAPVKELPSPVALVAWVRPTRIPDQSAIALCAQHADGSLAWGLGIAEDGHWQLLADDMTVPAGKAELGTWHLVQLVVDTGTGVRLTLTPQGSEPSAVTARVRIPRREVSRLGIGGGLNTHATFDGIIAEPCLAGRALTDDELDAIQRGAGIETTTGNAFLASWAFPAAHPPTATGPHTAGPAALRNTPAAAMPGPHGVLDALHCHADDLTDAEWPISMRLHLPVETRSGVYAVRLHSDRGTDRIPFVVPPPVSTSARALLLLPTMTYLAYANEQQPRPGNYLEHAAELAQPTVLDRWLARHPEYGFSTYDRHADGSGVNYSGLRRPISNIRPDYLHWISGEPRHLGADLFIVDWLDRTGIDYDVACDHNLDAHEFSLLEPYRVVLTGSHPEYYTEAMLNALGQHLARDGRLMYLGGNGFYWVTSASPDESGTIEVRRGPRGYPWQCPKSQATHAFDGHTGGFWADNGRPPHEIVGVTFAAMGLENPAPGYTINDSVPPHEQWIMDGVKSQTIGTQGRLLDGAAGHEIDNVAKRNGASPGITIVASSTDHADTLQLAPDRQLARSESNSLGADLVLYRRSQGGTVLSTGSICWCGTLAEHGGDEGTRRVTENALFHFLESSTVPEQHADARSNYSG